jgi:hypothetical protein
MSETEKNVRAAYKLLRWPGIVTYLYLTYGGADFEGTDRQFDIQAQVQSVDEHSLVVAPSVITADDRVENELQVGTPVQIHDNHKSGVKCDIDVIGTAYNGAGKEITLGGIHPGDLVTIHGAEHDSHDTCYISPE